MAQGNENNNTKNLLKRESEMTVLGNLFYKNLFIITYR